MKSENNEPIRVTEMEYLTKTRELMDQADREERNLHVMGRSGEVRLTVSGFQRQVIQDPFCDEPSCAEAVASLRRELELAHRALADARARCTELLLEARIRRGVPDQALVLPGWTCLDVGCRAYNGEVMARRVVCRACGAARPT